MAGPSGRFLPVPCRSAFAHGHTVSTQVRQRPADEVNQMIDDLEEMVRGAVTAVFSTMLNFQPTMLGSPPETSEEGHIAGCVGFIGRLTGVVYIYATERFARLITSRMLGRAEDEIEGEEMVNDTMGELSNMVVGHLKSRLADRGMPCVLTIPSIVRGQQFNIEPVTSATRRVAVFGCGGHQFVVEVLVKPSD